MSFDSIKNLPYVWRYRRGKEESNDIDIVFSHREIGEGRGALQSLVFRLKSQGIITHTLRKCDSSVFSISTSRDI